MEIRPILSALRHNLTGALLIATQVALTLAIISNSASVIRERLAVSQRDSGVDAESRILTQRPILFSQIDLANLIQTDLDALRAIPGVESVTVTNQVPMGRSGWSSTFATERVPTAPSQSAGLYFDGGRLLETFGLKLVEGRGFRDDEIVNIDPKVQNPPPTGVLLTRRLAEALFPGQSQFVGRTFYQGNNADAEEMRVVGVIERFTTPWAQTGPGNEYAVVFPARYLNPFNHYVVRAAPGAEAEVRKAMEAALEKNEPGRVSTGQYSIQEMRDRRYRGERALAWLLVSVTVFLLGVTASGIVGMASLWVNLRRKQIGVRRALGATRGDIVRYFLTENLLITSAGIAVGVLAAWGLNGVLMSELSVPRLPLEYLAVGVLLMLLLGVIAVLGPALRAAQLSPALATRSV